MKNLTHYPRTILVGIGLALIPTPSFTQPMTGNELLEDLRDWDDPKNVSFTVGSAVGFVWGVADTLMVLNRICPPGTVTKGQLVRVVYKGLTDNPVGLHRPAFVPTANALITAFPCEKKP